jgi:hypothetical protein
VGFAPCSPGVREIGVQVENPSPRQIDGVLYEHVKSTTPPGEIMGCGEHRGALFGAPYWRPLGPLFLAYTVAPPALQAGREFDCKYCKCENS